MYLASYRESLAARRRGPHAINGLPSSPNMTAAYRPPVCGAAPRPLDHVTEGDALVPGTFTHYRPPYRRRGRGPATWTTTSSAVHAVSPSRVLPSVCASTSRGRQRVADRRAWCQPRTGELCAEGGGVLTQRRALRSASWAAHGDHAPRRQPDGPGPRLAPRRGRGRGGCPRRVGWTAARGTAPREGLRHARYPAARRQGSVVRVDRHVGREAPGQQVGLSSQRGGVGPVHLTRLNPRGHGVEHGHQRRGVRS